MSMVHFLTPPEKKRSTKVTPQLASLRQVTVPEGRWVDMLCARLVDLGQHCFSVVIVSYLDEPL